MTSQKFAKNLSISKYVVIMKVGYHTDETLDGIIERKRMEDIQGPFFWGYGGTVCHPRNQVQPFVEEAKLSEQKVYLLMAFTPSKHKAQPIVSTHYSTDNTTWYSIPDYAHITGSKYALVCRQLRSAEIEVNLNHYIVGMGPKSGTRVTDYLRRRVDKVCAVYNPPDNADVGSSKLVQIQYIAELVEPYAVFLRSDDYNDGTSHRQLQLFD